MASRPERMGSLLEAIDTQMTTLPGVFSTAQWGGRAYKLPGPGGSRKKPKLLAHVVMAKDHEHVSVSFKLSKERAERAVEKRAWIERNSFGKLGQTGWVEARISTQRQIAPLGKLLAESHAQYPQTMVAEAEADDRAASRNGVKTSSSSNATSTTARHMDAVMREVTADGWQPGQDDF